jgi:hypothetical protein
MYASAWTKPEAFEQRRRKRNVLSWQLFAPAEGEKFEVWFSLGCYRITNAV